MIILISCNKQACNNLDDLGTLFMYLSSYYNTKLYNRESVIIFDEVQMFPKAGAAVKYPVNDGRCDYIETMSLMSIRKNERYIIIPSEGMTDKYLILLMKTPFIRLVSV